MRDRARNFVPILGALELIGHAATCPRGCPLDTDKLQITVLDLPIRKQIDVPVQEQLIVELYSK